MFLFRICNEQITILQSIGLLMDISGGKQLDPRVVVTAILGAITAEHIQTRRCRNGRLAGDSRCVGLYYDRGSRAGVSLPALMAGEPATNARVFVKPPLFANVARMVFNATLLFLSEAPAGQSLARFSNRLLEFVTKTQCSWSRSLVKSSRCHGIPIHNGVSKRNFGNGSRPPVAGLGK